MKEIGFYTKDNATRKIELNALGIGIETLIVSENTNKQNDKSPDFLVFYNRTPVGSLWKKTSKNGNSYLSGNIFLLLEERFINILFGDVNKVFLVNPNGTKEDTF